MSQKKTAAVKRVKTVCHSSHKKLVWLKRTEFLEFITVESRNLTLAYSSFFPFSHKIRGVLCLLQEGQKKASAEMREIQPDTQAVSTPVSDLSWTHGQRRVAESSDDEITEEESQTLGGYNTAMAQNAGLSDIKTLYTEEGLGLGNRGRKTNLREKGG